MSSVVTNLTPDTATEERAARSHLARRLLHNGSALFAIIVLGLTVLAAIVAPLLTSQNPNFSDVQSLLAPPSTHHLLGTDAAGRDLFARLLYGTRYSLAAALLGTAIAALLGVIGGLVAGYYGRWFESIASWIVSAIMALPGIVVLLAARSVLGPSLWLAMIVFGVLLSPAFYRLVYTAVINVRGELFVDAARVSGVGDLSIIGRHIFSVVRAPIIIQFAFVMGIAIAIQAGLDFLGLGDQSIPTWGNMLNDAFARLYSHPVLLVWPSFAIAITSVALALFANALRDELERSGTTKKPKSRTSVVIAKVLSADVVIHDEAHEDAREKLLVVDSLVIGYDQPDGTLKQVVNGVSLTVRKGEVHGLIGESGSGKTQTAWSILRLLPENGRIAGGSVVFEGSDLASLSEKEMRAVSGRRISYIPQEPMSNLDPSFTIGSQLVEPMTITLGISKTEAKKRALDLLARVGIPDPGRTFAAYPHEVSGGMAQRVLIAGAVSCEPDLVIADEPTTALDVTVQADILDLLRGLQKELGVSILIVTHNFGVVADLCDRVSVMRDGLIVETGPARAIFSDPQHPYTQSLFAAVLEDGAARGALDQSADRHTLTEGAAS